MFKIFSILIISVSLFAEIQIENPNIHNENGNFFDNLSVDTSSGFYSSKTDEQKKESLIGDDTLPTTNFTSDRTSHIRTGNTNLKTSISKNGKVVVIDNNGSEYTLEKDLNTTGFNTEEEYINMVKSSLLRDNNNSEKSVILSQMIQENRSISELKRKQLAKVQDSKESLSDRVVKYGGNSPVESSSGLVSIFTESDVLLPNSNNSIQDQREIEDNASKYYKDHYILRPDYDTSKNLLADGTTAFGRGYADSKTLSDEITARFKGQTIKCYIARSLLPSYKCPISYKSELRFPTLAGDVRKTDLAEAKADCDKFCVTNPGDYPIISKNILDSDVFNTNINNVTIYPAQSSLSLILDNDDRMPLDHITIHWKIEKPSSFEGTDAEWNDLLINNLTPRVNIDIIGYKYGTDSNGNLIEIPMTIYGKYLIKIYGSDVQTTLPLSVDSIKYKLNIYVPYFETVKKKEQFQEYNAEIKIDNVDSKYKSTDYYYCSFLQTVSNKKLCDSDSLVESINVAGQDVFLCYDRSHKIGPEPATGAFFNEEDARKECVAHYKCEPTYTFVSNNSSFDQLFVSKIGCVDSPDNSACSDEDCKSLFASDNKVINEKTLILNKGLNTFDYTIKNGIRTEIPRPKIHNKEMFDNIVDNYDDVFASEEKDQAYINMIDSVSYNRFKQRIGEESPAAVAYRNRDEAYNDIVGILKPASFDYSSSSNFYVYAISVVDSIFAPMNGTWIINGNTIKVTPEKTTINGIDSTSGIINQNEVVPLLFPNDPEKQQYYENVINGHEPIKFMDRMFLIKSSSDPEKWTEFRRIRNYRFYNKKIIYHTTTTEGIASDTQNNLTYSVFPEWVNIPAYRHDNYETMDPDTGNFLSVSKSQTAPYFKVVNFNHDQTFYNFRVTEDAIATRYATPGVMFLDQEISNNGSYYKRKYISDTSSENREAKFFNQKFILIYSDTPLTYEELVNKFYSTEIDDVDQNNQWLLFGYAHKNLYKTEIPHDGELNNNVKIWKKGIPSDLTFKWIVDPKLGEKGKKVYKFSFLFSDQEYGSLDLNTSQ